jgi:hypothetical protein
MTSTDPAGGGSRSLVDHVPVLWVQPAPTQPAAPLALWLPPLTGTKEDSLPILRRLAAAGFMAVSLDRWQHGQRGTEPGEQIAQRVFGNFRRHMWPILGQTTLDALWVIDWAMATLDSGPGVVAGGMSMGGGRRRGAGRHRPAGQPGWRHRRHARLDPLSHLHADAHGPAVTSSAAPTTPTSRPVGRCASRPPCARPTRPWPSGSGSPYIPVSGTWMGRSTRHWHGTA